MRVESPNFVRLYCEVHDLYRHFAALDVIGDRASTTGGALGFDSFDDMCKRGLVIKRKDSVYRNMRVALIDVLMRDVVLRGLDEDAAVACRVSPSAYRCMIPMVNDWYDGDGDWLDISVEQLKTWAAASERTRFRNALMAVWIRARSIAEAKACAHPSQAHFDAAATIVRRQSSASTVATTAQTHANPPTRLPTDDEMDEMMKRWRIARAAARGPCRPYIVRGPLCTTCVSAKGDVGRFGPTIAKNGPTLEPLGGGAATTARADTHVAQRPVPWYDGPSLLTRALGARTTVASSGSDVVDACVGTKRTYDAMKGVGQDDNIVEKNGDGGPVAGRRRRLESGREKEEEEADRLRRGLSGALDLGDLGLMLQATARLVSRYTQEEMRAMVVEAYATRHRTGRSTGARSDTINGSTSGKDEAAAKGTMDDPDLWAPAAFVEWFAAHHETYGLANTPDYVWNTMVPPRSPNGVADPWSRSYWLCSSSSSSSSPPTLPSTSTTTISTTTSSPSSS
ncbi:hypothetical protein pmac_cds_922 [Pandoravirus macleodensis]|uniref:Uncharacterized protein n=1 Tax=Pandoravirus macleodensis TaxID=2107707 RepID=A0A2U7UGT4_9VIRU|nr:hypothetical protein pmac_cds_922 [Pandoravirus macleodensis]AVK77610.1 hypothetical protein pmac_cds_922 [Pandoravirus macleodensis]